MIWIGLGIAFAGLCVGLGLNDIAKAIRSATELNRAGTIARLAVDMKRDG